MNTAAPPAPARRRRRWLRILGAGLLLAGAVAVGLLESRLPDVRFAAVAPRGLAGRPLDCSSLEGRGEAVRLDLAEPGGERSVFLPEGVSVRMLSLSVQGPVRGFWMDTDTSVDFSSLEASIRDVTAGARSDRERAEALWKFMMDVNIHGPRPLEAAYGNFSPLHHLTSYGYSMCGNATSTLAFLWESAGLPARTWSLRGHVVPEVFYGGRWHLYDPDERRAFVSPADGSVAGIEDLQRDPSLVASALDAHGRGSKGESRAVLERLYTVGASVDHYYRVRDQLWEDGDLERLLQNPRYVVDLYRYARLHQGRPLSTRIAVDLGAGDSLHLFWGGEDLRYALAAPESVYEDAWGAELRRPARHANGALVWRPRDGSGCRLRGLEIGDGGLRLGEGVPEGRLERDVESPFLVTDAVLSGTLDPRGGGLRIEVRTPDGGWQPVGAERTEPGPFSLDLRPINSLDRPQVVYGYGLALTLRRGADEAEARLDDLQLRTHLQVNPAALPRLRAGANRVTLHGELAAPGALVEMRWIDDPDSLAAFRPRTGEPPSPCFSVEPDLLAEPPGEGPWSRVGFENLGPRVTPRLSYLTTLDPTAPARLEWLVDVPARVRRVHVRTRAQIDRPEQQLTLWVSSGDSGDWQPVWRKTDSPYPELFPEDTADISSLVQPGRPFRLRWTVEGATVRRREPRLAGVQVLGLCDNGPEEESG